jgi:hypothetical protein
MIAVVQSVVAGQYGAALRMLCDCMRGADPAAWQATVGRFPFWHVAYHTLYFTDLYLSPDERGFQPPLFHREDSNWLAVNLAVPQKEVVASLPYDKETLAAYLDACRAKARRAMEGETEATLAGPSGFPWLGFTRLEAHLYNIRHIQHHTGQLSASLQRHLGAGAEWAYSEPL